MTKRSGALRIIGGEWRSRVISFDASSGVRPTGDRIRETLFNWLQAVTPGARCLDLFAGSGALGLEALSRGAGEVVFVERSNRLASALRNTLKTLAAEDRAQVIAAEAARYLAHCRTRFDIVFLDPPFATDMLDELCATLEQQGLLNEAAYIYIETPKSGTPPLLPSNWSVTRAKIAGQVSYQLAQRQP